MALIRVANVGQEYGGKYVLKGVNLEIESGEVFALIGPTGAGKTTLIRLLNLLETPTSGQVYFDGVDVTRSERQRLKARRRMAYVQQKPIVFKMNVYGNVACGLKWRKVKKEVVRSKVDNALELVGMLDYTKRDARTLSGGEMQRVAIARALVTDPEVLLLDEPTANLDPISIAKVEEVLEQIIGEKNITILMATHDIPQGQRLAGRMGVLINGEILQIGSPNEVFCSPQNREVAELVGVENVLAGVITYKEDELVTVEVNGNSIQAISELPLGEKVHVLIRPEDITFTPSRNVSSARNMFDGEIIRMTQVGQLVRIEVDCAIPLLGVLTRVSAQELGLAMGKRLYASFKVTAIHVIKRKD
ncbi:MAG: ATP-binding cassette domain-containing protein [Dehalococcoidia bacterium]|jgi:tungstate transport system ATP-binding protein|nr:ATP-binding cassette domain-containing protein [Dehalococcoidia bacterium]